MIGVSWRNTLRKCESRDLARAAHGFHLSSLLICCLLPVLTICTLSCATAAPQFHAAQEFTSFPLADKPEHLLSETDARFSRGENEWVWISDAEHMVWDDTGEQFLADSTQPMCLARDVIPAERKFELFPYHYFRRKDYTSLGNRLLNYRLVARNETTGTVSLHIKGKGTTRDWHHYKAWEAALSGNESTTITIAPGGQHVIWKAQGLQPDLPWSAIIFGQADGPLVVADYCYLDENAPLLQDFAQMPDLAWPPYMLASFTRGSADWYTARVQLMPGWRNASGELPISKLQHVLTSVALAYSPGGPITKLSEYKYVAPSFARDSLMVRDPVTSYSHHFFGGNYPVVYDATTSFVNDTSDTMQVRLWLCSNDRFNVDSFVGVWNALSRQMLWARVPSMPKNNRWNPVSLLMAPGAREALPAVIVPLGSRWGGFVASWEVSFPPENRSISKGE